LQKNIFTEGMLEFAQRTGAKVLLTQQTKVIESVVALPLANG